MRRVLVIANQTLGGDHLAEVITATMAEQPTTFLLLVPATHHTDVVVALAEAFAVQGGMRPPAADVDHDATDRLTAGLDWMLSLGATADGEVVDHDPVPGVRDLPADKACSSIIVSTLLHGLSAWLHQDLPHRLERATGLPVTVASAPDLS